MGFWRRLFGSSDDSLTKTLLDAENRRQERAAQVEIKRLDLEQFRIEQEFAHLRESGEQRRLDAEQSAELRRRRRELAQDMRDKRNLNREKQRPESNPAPAGSPVGFRSDCRVCTNENPISHSAAEIIFHSNGHKLAAV